MALAGAEKAEALEVGEGAEAGREGLAGRGVVGRAVQEEEGWVRARAVVGGPVALAGTGVALGVSVAARGLGLGLGLEVGGSASEGSGLEVRVEGWEGREVGVEGRAPEGRLVRRGMGTGVAAGWAPGHLSGCVGKYGVC